MSVPPKWVSTVPRTWGFRYLGAWPLFDVSAPAVGWCMLIFEKSISRFMIRMVCAGRKHPKTTKTNEWDSGDNPRVSGHPKRTISDEGTASQSRWLFGKSWKIAKIPGIFSLKSMGSNEKLSQAMKNPKNPQKFFESSFSVLKLSKNRLGIS